MKTRGTPYQFLAVRCGIHQHHRQSRGFRLALVGTVRINRIAPSAQTSLEEGEIELIDVPVSVQISRNDVLAVPG